MTETQSRPGPSAESEAVMNFRTILGVTGVLCSVVVEKHVESYLNQQN